MLERLYVCQWCFGYCRDILDAIGHRRVCKRGFGGGRALPGKCIYSHPVPRAIGGKASESAWSVWEVDGEVDTVSLLSQ